MQDADKTREELIAEVQQLRATVSKLQGNQTLLARKTSGGSIFLSPLL